MGLLSKEDWEEYIKPMFIAALDIVIGLGFGVLIAVVCLWVGSWLGTSVF